MNVGGINTLACIWYPTCLIDDLVLISHWFVILNSSNIDADLSKPVNINPLPHMFVVKDLVTVRALFHLLVLHV